MERNEYQNRFLEYIADIQESCVEITLAEHKITDKQKYGEMKSLMMEATFNVIVDIMEMIDGYSGFTEDKLDIINKKTGECLKENPFIELHDAVCEFVKYE